MAEIPILNAPTNGTGHKPGRLRRSRRNRPRGGWATIRDRITYAPDAEFSAEAFMTPADEYAKRFLARESYRTPTGQLVTPGVDAVLLEPVQESQRWKPVRITSMRELRQFFESQSGQLKYPEARSALKSSWLLISGPRS